MIYVICKDLLPVCYVRDSESLAVEAFERARQDELRKPENERRKIHWHTVRKYSPLPIGAIPEELRRSPLLDDEIGDSLDRIQSLQSQITSLESGLHGCGPTSGGNGKSLDAVA